jgi:hypothetical protein
VYASWNGATTVRRWQVLAGAGTGRLRPVASAADRGFETLLHVTSGASTFAVRALGHGGRILATSRAVKAG